MKVAVSSSGTTLNDPVDPRFGRCAHFVLVDTDTLEATAFDNPGTMQAQGAGIQAAQYISSIGAGAVIAGNFGPNAFQALAAAGITIYTGAQGTVRDAVSQLSAGQLSELFAPSVQAHAGMAPGAGQGSNPGPGTGMGRGGGMGPGSGGGMGGGFGRGQGMGRGGGGGRGRGRR